MNSFLALLVQVFLHTHQSISPENLEVRSRSVTCRQKGNGTIQLGYPERNAVTRKLVGTQLVSSNWEEKYSGKISLVCKQAEKQTKTLRIIPILFLRSFGFK